jgi:serine O-acetyltransferase
MFLLSLEPIGALRAALRPTPSTADQDSQPPSILGLIRGDMSAWVAIWSGRDSWDPAPVSLLTGLHFMWLYPGLRATAFHRVAHGLYSGGIKVLPNIVAQLNLMLHGLDIPSKISIGPRLYIPHPVGTVITAERMGSDITLVSCVTIGMRNERIFPTIGDRVFIGAGARILGGIRVGNDVSVGANAVVLEDVPDRSVAVGVPARIRPARSAA